MSPVNNTKLNAVVRRNGTQASGSNSSAKQSETSGASESNNYGQVVSGYGFGNPKPFSLLTASLDGDQARKNQSKLYEYVSSPEANSPSPIQMEPKSPEAENQSPDTRDNSDARDVFRTVAEQNSVSGVKIEDDFTYSDEFVSCVKRMRVRPGVPTIMCRVFGQLRERLMLDDFVGMHGQHDERTWNQWCESEPRPNIVAYYKQGDEYREWENFKRVREQRIKRGMLAPNLY